MNWMIPCKRAAELMVAREDRPLELGERAALRVHLLVCKACNRFEGQMLTMRRAMDSWRSYREAEPGGGLPPAGATQGIPPEEK
jgi:hypothetical protein